ncbi:hypothetical protein [Ensifer adhaerens]
MDVDTAISITLREMKGGTASNYGYDLYPATVSRNEAHRQSQNEFATADTELALDPYFYEAAWELCRRGIVRPGVRNRHSQAVADGGYCLTIAGRQKLAELQDDEIIILQPGSLAIALAAFSDRFGEAFNQRSQEAIRCRNAEAWLACCAMAGAAAESILLSVAIAKTGNEEDVRKKYNAAGGRQQVINLIVGQLPNWHNTTFKTFAGIISLWRDEAAHGATTSLTTANADESLRQLLHMCQWVEKHWDVLTA